MAVFTKTNKTEEEYIRESLERIYGTENVTFTLMDIGYYIKCNNKEFIYDKEFNQHEVNSGNTEFWKYTENEDGTLTITGYNYDPETEVIIPNFINGKRVKIVSCNFKNNTNLTKMQISYGIERIEGSSLFADCINLEGDINLPSSLKYVGHGAFTRCSKLTGDLNLKNVEFIGNHVFNSCTGLNGKLIMNPNGTSLGYYSFRMCKNLKGKAIISDFTIDNGGSFTDCDLLEEIEFMEGITNIPNFSFNNCSNIKKVTILNTIKEIGSQAFYCCSKMEILIVPSTIEKIGRLAFSGCKSLDCTINLPSNVELGENAFNNCGKLVINYID